MTDLNDLYQRQPYIRKLREAVVSGAIPYSPGLFAVDVRHAADCPALSPSGLCTCDPVVTPLGPMSNRHERRVQRKADRRRG